MTQSLTLTAVSADYGTTRVLEDLSLTVGKGELVSLLGSSGCGKTTTLRLVAGFMTPTSGTITLGDRDLTRVAAHKRDIGLVFQNYALFPHLSVADNVAYGLKTRGIGAAERHTRASPPCSPASASPTSPSACPPPFPAARSSASRLPAPSSSSRRC